MSLFDVVITVDIVLHAISGFSISNGPSRIALDVVRIGGGGGGGGGAAPPPPIPPILEITTVDPRE